MIRLPFIIFCFYYMLIGKFLQVRIVDVFQSHKRNGNLLSYDEVTIKFDLVPNNILR